MVSRCEAKSASMAMGVIRETHPYHLLRFMPLPTDSKAARLLHSIAAHVRTAHIRDVLAVLAIWTQRRMDELTRALLGSTPDCNVHELEENPIRKALVTPGFGETPAWIHAVGDDGQ